MSLNDPTREKPSGTTRIVRRMLSFSAAGVLVPSMSKLASPWSVSAFRRSIFRPLPFGPRSMTSRCGPAVLKPVAVAVNATVRRTSLSLVTRMGTSTVSVCEISSGNFGSMLNGLRASMIVVMAPMRPSVRVPGDEHLIPGDVVGKLELDGRLAGLRQHQDRVPVHGLGEVRAHVAERRVALVGILAHHERHDRSTTRQRKSRRVRIGGVRLAHVVR